MVKGTEARGFVPVSAQQCSSAWQAKAACRGPQAAVFFPPPQFERKADRIERERRAKAICAGCPVETDCLSYSIQIGESHGIWGGLNESERRSLESQRS
jgi:WhiB family redox-sensing transcriptional regulator